jgi:hypothetical protein
MEQAREGHRVSYRSRRHWASAAPATLEVDYETGDDLGVASEGTLEHFLVERYYLYAATSGGKLLRGQVHHRPYPIRGARIRSLDESLLAAAGLQRPDERASVLWSEGVDVEIFGLKRAL